MLITNQDICKCHYLRLSHNSNVVANPEGIKTSVKLKKGERTANIPLDECDRMLMDEHRLFAIRFSVLDNLNRRWRFLFFRIPKRIQPWALQVNVTASPSFTSISFVEDSNTNGSPNQSRKSSIFRSSPPLLITLRNRVRYTSRKFVSVKRPAFKRNNPPPLVSLQSLLQVKFPISSRSNGSKIKYQSGDSVAWIACKRGNGWLNCSTSESTANVKFFPSLKRSSDHSTYHRKKRRE